jgi:ABC-type Zn2+ transport system substrate-binding protein/surface adhesin
MAPVKGQPVFLFHPSFNYFLQRYGLVYAGVIEPFPGKEPSPKYLQGIVKRVTQVHARALFTETLLPVAPAGVIAEAAHVPLVELDPGCGNSGRSYSDYADWVRYNARLFLQALDGDGTAAHGGATLAE